MILAPGDYLKNEYQRMLRLYGQLDKELRMLRAVIRSALPDEMDELIKTKLDQKVRQLDHGLKELARSLREFDKYLVRL